MSDENKDSASGHKGRFVSAHHFFSSDFRGTFARYERQDDAGAVKRCLRIEIRRREGEGHIKMEVNVGAATELYAVLTGRRQTMSLRIPNRNGGAKLLAVNRGTEKDWVLTMSQRQAKNEPTLTMTMPFDKDCAFAAGGLCLDSYQDPAGNSGLAGLLDRFCKIGVLT